jgi:raffinose synthase
MRESDLETFAAGSDVFPMETGEPASGRKARPGKSGRAPFPALGEAYRWVPDRNLQNRGGFIRLRRDLGRKRGELPELGLGKGKRWLAIGTHEGPFWNRVRQGADWSKVPAGTQFLVWKEGDAGFGLLLPLLCGDCVITARGAKRGVILAADGGKKGAMEAGFPVAYAGRGPDLYSLVKDSMQRVAARQGSFKLREDKETPRFVDGLGWCSWDAFYGEVDQAKMLEALESFQRGGLMPGFVILDDGWLDRRKGLLRSFRAHAAKFPEGLAGLAARIKKYGVRHFGVWHTLAGYWAGVDPQGGLARSFRLAATAGCVHPGKRERLSLVHPSQAGRFFNAFHGQLRKCGVDFVKVDGQSALALFTCSRFGRVSAMRAYQKALQASAFRHFKGGLIHCMSNGLDVAYQLARSVVWRNSDDYFPKKGSSAQQEHVWANALNNLWTGQFALPDWDMFQSHGPDAEFHAAARALSGGPVYVCDKPGLQNFAILHRLADDAGNVRRCDRPALPAPECVFADCRTEPVLLKIHNRAGRAGLLGFFHCSERRGRLRGSYAAEDVPGLDGERFVARHYSDGRIVALGRREHGGVELPRMGFEIVTLSPVLAGWMAALGREGRYAGAAWIGETDADAATAEVRTWDGGRFVFWCASRPDAVEWNGRKLRADFRPDNGRLVVEAPTRGVFTLFRGAGETA